MQTYTKEEVLKHCTRESCWVYIGNVVFVLCVLFWFRYDLTNYIDKHPPGAQMILNCAKKGQDARGMFAIHSTRAKQLWESMKIGMIALLIVCLTFSKYQSLFQTLFRPIYHLKYFHFIFIIWIILEEVLNSTLVEIREGKAILLGTLDLASVFQIRVRTSSLHLARPKMWELPRRARFPPFCKDINICRVFQDGADIVYKMVRTKEIVYFPVCCLTIVLQNSETSDFSHLYVTRSYLRDEKNRELYNRYLSENPDPDVLCCYLYWIRTWSLLQFMGLMV